MKATRVLCTLLLASAALVGGCGKKKGDDASAAKTAEGSAAVAGSAATAPTPTPTPTPAAADPGSSATPAAVAPAGTPAAAPTEAIASATILETAKQAGTFTVFLKAVDAAGIAENLNGAGPFTVFAPTDDAFAKIPAADLDALLADKTKLTAVLQYHVVAGKLSAQDLGSAKVEASVAGPELAIDATSGLKVGGATVVKPDIAASNGVIHAIDTVLTPPAK